MILGDLSILNNHLLFILLAFNCQVWLIFCIYDACVVCCIHNIYLFMETHDDVLKLSVSCRLQVTLMNTCGVKTQEPNRRHQCGINQEPSECQISK